MPDKSYGALANRWLTLLLAWPRHKFFQTSFARSFLAITVGGAVIAAMSAALEVAAGS